MSEPSVEWRPEFHASLCEFVGKSAIYLAKPLRYKNKTHKTPKAEHIKKILTTRLW